MTRQRNRPGAAAATPARRSRLAIAAFGLALAGLALGGAALALVLLRPGTSEACRQAAWSSLPAPGSLPNGWTMSGSGIYIDSVGTTLGGPAPSASDEIAPAIFVSVGCYGPDAHDGLLRSHVVSLSEGAVDVPFASVGEESFATSNQAAGQSVVLFRRGPLVATLAAAGSISAADLETAARAVDAAMEKATNGATALPSVPAAGGAASPPATPGPSAPPSAAPSDEAASHADPDLEALLPASIGDTTLDRESYVATKVLGTDTASKALTDSLKALGASPSDLRIAEAFDSSGAATWYLDAFRLPGVGGSRLATAVVEGWITAGSSGATRTNRTIGGKHVVHVTAGSGSGGLSDFVYVHGDVVFDIATTETAVVRKILAALP
ncbi:MAG TPA: hypothetical protein VFS32_08340 [Candidatus Limnocylindrales bacterium]|nr:hypothetical protein [Candidatus Limnocylindrales bacterium]